MPIYLQQAATIALQGRRYHAGSDNFLRAVTVDQDDS